MAIDFGELDKKTAEKIEELSKNINFLELKHKGSNGTVVFGHHKILERDIVVKFYYWGDGVHAEPAMLATLECDQILKVYHAESIDEDDAYFITQFCPKGDLDDEMARRKFGVLEAVDALLQLTAGVNFLHGRGYLHRDLKPENIFCISEDKHVIGDFGSVVKQNPAGFSKTFTKNSLLYRPPEEINCGCTYKQSDIYQLGIVLYQLLGGYLPYAEADWLSAREQAAYKVLPDFEKQKYATEIIEGKIKKGRLLNLRSLPAWVPKALRSTIRRACNVEFSSRFESAADLSAHLNNIRRTLPDWRFDEYPTLHRPPKQFRIVPAEGAFEIQKNVGAGWRTERKYAPASLQEAISIAEGL